MRQAAIFNNVYKENANNECFCNACYKKVSKIDVISRELGNIVENIYDYDVQNCETLSNSYLTSSIDFENISDNRCKILTGISLDNLDYLT